MSITCDDLTFLHSFQSSKGNVDVIEKLIENEADVNCADDLNGWTPLHLAAINRERDAAEYLISQGALVDIEDKYGDMPKHCVKSRSRHRDLYDILSNKPVVIDEIDQGSDYGEDEFEG